MYGMVTAINLLSSCAVKLTVHSFTEFSSSRTVGGEEAFVLDLCILDTIAGQTASHSSTTYSYLTRTSNTDTTRVVGTVVMIHSHKGWD